MTMNVPADPQGSADRPSIHGFQLDASSVGDIARSVNLFRGDVNIPLTLASLTSRNGLSLGLNAFYAGNVIEQAKTWNATAGTSVLGLGWVLGADRIFVDGKSSGAPLDGTYFLQSGGGVDRLIWCGEDGDGVLFQSRANPLWQIRYEPAQEQWRVLRDDGTLALYGGSAAAGNPLMWGVRWENWIGSSLVTTPQPRQYVVGWNLVELKTPWGDGLTYSYQHDDVALSGGVDYTRASYLLAVSDMLGQSIRLNHRPKESYEYVPPHTHPDGTPDPAYQDRYETLYLDSVDIYPPGAAAPEYSMVFQYLLANPSGAGGDVFIKRFLAAVTQESRGLRALPPMQFTYNLDPMKPAPGALTGVQFPEGGGAAYGYERIELNRGTGDDVFLKNITVPNPLPGSRPVIWHGPGYVVVAWYSEARASTLVEVYSVGGRWSEPFRTSFPGRISVDDTRVLIGAELFAIYFRQLDSTRVRIRVFERIPWRFGDWKLMELEVPARGTLVPEETVLTGGTGFILFHAGGDTFVYRWTYDRISETWEEDLRQSGTAKIALAAAESYYIAAYYTDSSQSASYQIFHRDASGGWNAGILGPFGNSFPWRAEYAGSLWSLGATFAIATYFPANAATSKLRMLVWDETWDVIHDQVHEGDSFPSVVIGSMVANGRRAYRFDGNSWHALELAPGTSATRFAYGDDVLVVSYIEGSSERSTIATYRADDGEWLLADASATTRQPPARAAQRMTLAPEQVFAPTVGIGYMTVGEAIRRRTPDGRWIVVGALPASAAKASLQNRAPEYIAYEDQPIDVPATTTTVLLLENGTVARTASYPGQRLMTADQTVSAASLAGGNVFITYPAGQSILSPSEIYLHRILNHSVSDLQTDDVITSVTIDTGYQTSVTRYAYDGTTAVFDATGQVVQFPHVTESTADASGQTAGGRTEHAFFNGLPDETAGQPAGAQEFYSLLTGLIRETRAYDASGIEVSSEQQEWDAIELQHGIDSPVGVLVHAVQMRPVRTTGALSALQLFPLPSSNAASFDAGTIPDSVRTTFTQRGLPLGGGAKVSTVSAGKAWRIDDGPNVYPIFARAEDLIVLGSIVQQTEATYDPATALPVTSLVTTYGSDGKAALTESRNVYAWRIAAYAGMKAARMLNSIAEERTTNVTENVTVSATATTFADDWGARRVWARRATFLWRGPSSIAPAFDFAAGAANPEWLGINVLSTRNAQGQPFTSRTTLSPVTSILYDSSGYHPVATCTNSDLSRSRDAGYLGFESYEQLQGWTASSGSISALVTTADAHTGVRSLQLPGGAITITNRFQVPASIGRCLFAVWVKTAAGYAGGASWTFVMSAGTASARAELPVPATDGAWQQIWRVLDLSPLGATGSTLVSVDCTLANGASGQTVLVDDVRFSALAGGISAQVYDTGTFEVSASVEATGATLRTVNDPFGRLIATIGPDEEVTALTSHYYSRDGNSGRFNPADPNSALTVAPADGGFLDDFHDGLWQDRWSSPDPAQWSVQDGVLVHTAAAPGSVTLRSSDDESDYGIRLELRLIGGARVTQPAGIRIGTLTVQWVPSGEWQLLDGTAVVARFSQATLLESDWSLIAGKRAVLFFRDGQQILSRYFTQDVGGALQLFAGDPGVGFEQVFVFYRPRLAAQYLDGCGITIQEQAQGDDGTLVGATVFDPLNRAAITTKKMRYDAQVLGYRAGFVTKVDWTTGVMSGELASYYSGGDRSNDEGYPYVRNRFSDSPAAAVLESGLPGAALAIRPGNTHTTHYVYAAKTNDGFLDTLPAAQYAVQRITDAGGTTQETVTGKDGQQIGRRTIPLDGDDIRVSFAYDARGTMVKTFPPNYHRPPAGSDRDSFIVTQQSDVLGNVLSMQTSDTGLTEFIYDDAGRLRFALSADGRSASGGLDRIVYQCYETMGRESEAGIIEAVWNRTELQAKANTSYPAGTVPGWQFRYEYDGDGSSIDAVTRPWRTLQNRGGSAPLIATAAWDAAGNVIGWTEQEGDDSHAVAYRYDVAGDALSIDYPPDVSALAEVTYRYDSLGQVVAVGTPEAETRFATYAYNADGSVAAAKREPAAPAPVEERYRYNPPGWPSSRQSALFTETLSYWEEPGYGGQRSYVGQVSRIDETFAPGAGESASWLNAYYGLSPLRTSDDTKDASASLGTGDAPLRYDANGNVVSFGDGSGSVQKTRSYSYETGTNRVKSIDGGPPFAYDRDGAAKTLPSGETLQYDPVTGLTAAMTAADGRGLVFDYDSSNRRRYKQVFDTGGALLSSRRYYNGATGGPLAVLAGAGGVEERVTYIYGPDGLVALLSGGIEASVIYDHLGSSRLVIARDGTVVGSYAYRPYGAFVRPPSGTRPDLLTYLYTGQERDAETGLYAFPARFYSPGLFRFLRTDPAGQSFSPYAYCNDDPWNAVDPTGEVVWFVALLISAAIGAAVGAVVGGAGYAIETLATGRKFSWGQFGMAVGIGAASGALAGLVGYGLGSAFVSLGATIGLGAIPSGIIGGGLSGAASGAVGGVTTQALTNVSQGRSIGADLGRAAIYGAVVGGVTGAAVGGLSGLFARAQSLNYRLSGDAQNNYNGAGNGRRFFGIVRDQPTAVGPRRMEIAPSALVEEDVSYVVNGNPQSKALVGQGPTGHGALAEQSGWNPNELGGYSLRRISPNRAEFTFNSGTLNRARYGDRTMPLVNRVAVMNGFSRDGGIMPSNRLWYLLVSWFGP